MIAIADGPVVFLVIAAIAALTLFLVALNEKL